MTQDPARLRLGRIRCLKEVIKSLEETKPLSEALCFVPKQLEYMSSGKGKALVVYQSPSTESKKVGEIKNDVSQKVVVRGLDVWNGQGQWLQLMEESQAKFLGEKSVESKKPCGWTMVQSSQVSAAQENGPNLTLFVKKSLPGLPSVGSDVVASKWEEAVEHAYSVRIGGTSQAVKEIAECCDTEVMQQLRQIRDGWTLNHDEELAKYIVATKQKENSCDVMLDSMTGDLSEYVQSIRASSENDEAQMLLDAEANAYWESDGSSGKHWLRLHIKPGVIIRRLYVMCDEDDGNFIPQVIEVAVGNSVDSMNILRSHEMDVPSEEVVVLENETVAHRYIELRVKRCFSDGVDTRIRGVKLIPASVQVFGLSQTMFEKADFSSYPKLDQNIPRESLYHRAIMLKRAVSLFDSVVSLTTPLWPHSLRSFGTLDKIRQLLVLSNTRSSLFSTFLRQSCSSGPDMPTIHLNRRLARDHAHDPAVDSTCKNALFTQMFEALKPANCGSSLDYRWPARTEQWWECVFSNEGMIDQGGGFRESLSEISEELCPSASDVPLPLKLFCRTPNQLHDTSNLYRDTYIPAPACNLVAQYSWIGQLMGACIRSKEHLILALPPFIWKQLNGEPVSWEQDYATVDAAQVRMLESLDSMPEEEYEHRFDGLLTFSVSRGDGSTTLLLPNGADIPVQYEDRLHYAELVKKARLEESKKQIDAMRSGLLSVIPTAFLDLVTWQELEQFVCGDPELPVESIRKTAHYDDGLSESSSAVKNLWTALEGFSNDERSRFLRFVTGRRRLPAPIWICPGREIGAGVDALPESATCSSTLFLPNYNSAKIAADKIRYAAYHCVAIDTDATHFDDE